MTDSPKVIRLLEQLAVAERDREVAILRGDHAIAMLSRDRARLGHAIEALRAVAANSWSAPRMSEIARDALQEIGQ